MMIDSHVHLWRQATPDLPWENTSGKYEEYSAAPEFLQAQALAAGITRAIAIQPLVYGRDHRFLERAVLEQGNFLTGVMLADPADPGAAETLMSLAEKGFRGVRLHRERLAQDLALDSPAVDRLVGLAAERGLVVDLFLGPDRYQEIDRLLSRYPRLHVALDHLGLPLLEDAAVDRLCALARHEGLFVKLSPAAETTGTAWPHADLAKPAAKVVNAFGSRRVMWGSNFPFYAQKPGYDVAATLVERLLPQLTAPQFEDLVANAAMTCFNL